MKAEFYARKLTKTAIRWIEVESFKGMETYIIEMMAIKGKNEIKHFHNVAITTLMMKNRLAKGIQSV